VGLVFTFDCACEIPLGLVDGADALSCDCMVRLCACPLIDWPGIPEGGPPPLPPGGPPPFCAIAYIASDKIATVIAVVLLMSPDFMVPLSLKFIARPAGFDTLRPVPTGKSSY
jgi:hypothetical protein